MALKKITKTEKKENYIYKINVARMKKKRIRSLMKTQHNLKMEKRLSKLRT